MAMVKMRGIRKSYDGVVDIIKGADLDIGDGEFMVFVGPSGCGKSTMLRMIAGLEDIDEGELWIGDNLANDLTPVERGIAMVFQNYALYPHMTVRENMEFSLAIGKIGKSEIDDRVNKAADILQIKHLLDRRPKALSGGQRQRVAIGRAIVRKPAVFLFDEPLSNLDAALRSQMRVELSRLHDELGVTMIYVTHDQVEAMTLGSRIAVFNAGVVEQIGAPLDLYHTPANLFVAGFLGSPKMNLLAARVVVDNGQGFLEVGGARAFGLPVPADPLGVKTVGIRPEFLRLASNSQALALPAKVRIVEQLGDHCIAYLDVPGESDLLSAKFNPRTDQIPVKGETVRLTADLDSLLLFGENGNLVFADGMPWPKK